MNKIKVFLNIIKFIINHPFNSKNKTSSIINFLKWQINCLINPYPIIYQFTKNSKIIVSKGLSGATGNLYCGLMEFQDMGFLLHFLRPEDLFVDIGANVGSYTILASAEIKANSICIEPVPSTFLKLNENILLNNMSSRVTSLNICLGNTTGKIKFTKSLDTVNHVATNDEFDTIEVDVNTLDNILIEKKPTILKIDVEGYEKIVLNGAVNTLKDKSLQAIIIELNGSGNRYGFDELEIHNYLINLGFQIINYDPLKKIIIKNDLLFNNNNKIYIRDIDFVNERIKKSRNIEIGNSGRLI